MPELPEVETVRRGLAPVLTGAEIARVDLRRPDLRTPFPQGFARALEGAKISSLDRRGKYLLIHLSTAQTWIVHLGMSGRLTVSTPTPTASPSSLPKSASRPATQTAAGGRDIMPGAFYDGTPARSLHDHVLVMFSSGAVLTYNDARRFGFMDLIPTAELEVCRHFAQMGPEPLSDGLTADGLYAMIARKSTPIKSALLDQSVVAGLGNIYVVEALWRAHIHPARLARDVTLKDCRILVPHIRDVLAEAIDAGGSTLHDYVASDGRAGGYQGHFRVYDRKDAPCPNPKCTGAIEQITQSGRSSYFCSHCQL